MRSRRVRWSQLTRRQRRLIVGLGSLEAMLTARAMSDLARRPVDQVRGPKALWALAVLVQPVGPVAYLVLGRRRRTG